MLRSYESKRVLQWKEKNGKLIVDTIVRANIYWYQLNI